MNAIAALPEHSADTHFIYALEFRDGTVKIGFTRTPRLRARKVQEKHKGVVVKATAVAVESKGVRYVAERHALEIASRIGVHPGKSKEVFHGLKFGEAVTALRQAARRVVAPKLAPTAEQPA